MLLHEDRRSIGTLFHGFPEQTTIRLTGNTVVVFFDVNQPLIAVEGNLYLVAVPRAVGADSTRCDMLDFAPLLIIHETVNDSGAGIPCVSLFRGQQDFPFRIGVGRFLRTIRVSFNGS
jgi:hypothetical protein